MTLNWTQVEHWLDTDWKQVLQFNLNSTRIQHKLNTDCVQMMHPDWEQIGHTLNTDLPKIEHQFSDLAQIKHNGEVVHSGMIEHIYNDILIH